ncbi:MAG: methyltransferase domain-containing protein [Moorea sp. SIO3G5]|nr:methyltransferase domain-containing protein [Moorena sp. SIO3G5]
MTLPRWENQSSSSKDAALLYDWRIYSIRQALKQKGKATGTLEIQDLLDLGHLDQYHYFGSQACDRAINYLSLNPNSRVLDIGSGVGGPARYISYKTGCHLQCVELRQDFSEIAQELTQRIGLDQRIQYLTGNVLSSEITDALLPNSFDNIISFLSLLHIEERDKVLEICFRALKENGYIYVEDYVANCTLTPEVKTTLKEVFKSSYVPSRETYRHHFERAGFTDICFIDLTTGWQRCIKERYQKFIESKEESIKLFGEDVYEHRSRLYRIGRDMLQEGSVGGALITAKKPCAPKIYQVPDTYFDPLTSVYNEQYHFFLEDGSLLALRHFKTKTLEHYSAWWSDIHGNSRELINTSEQKSSADHISIKKNDQTGTICLPEANLEVQFEVTTQFTWGVPGEENQRDVIHQPQLECIVHTDNGTQKAQGYCKIYEGNYPRFWGYHFVYALFHNYGIIWSAEATFGQERNNHFNFLNTSKLNTYELETSQTEKPILLRGEKSYHRQTSAHASIQNRMYDLIFDRAFATWSSIMRNQTSTMESNLSLEYREAILTIDDQEVSKGVCLKESCFGTIV